MRYTIIDTIKLELYRSDCYGLKYSWNTKRILKSLDKYSTVNSGNNEIYYKGSYHNFRVYLTENKLQLEGSLSKYQLGSNLKTLTFEDAIEAVEDMSYDFGLPLERAYIRRVDIGRNLIVRKQVRQYLSSFEETAGYYRDTTKNRVLYKSTNQLGSIQLYDKVEEIKKNDRELYEYHKEGVLKNKNILRIEAQLTQKVSKQLGYKSLRVVHLRSKCFSKKLNDVVLEKYKKLLTKRKFAFNPDTCTYTQVKNQLITFSLLELKTYYILEMLEELRKEGKMTSTQKMYSKTKLIDILKSDGCLVELDHIVELNKQMEFLHQQLPSVEYENIEKMIINRKPRTRLKLIS